MRSSQVTVVKLGGSHAGSPHLRGWMDALAGCAGRAIIVPGGGAFADAVRQAQTKMGFGDAVAHHMALLAMEQYGRALASLRPSFQIAASMTAIRRTLNAGGVPIWAPVAMVLRTAEIPASWDVTSDSLAVWLAGQFGAKRLFLVKHGRWGGEPVPAATLAARGVVDRAFPRFLAASAVEAALVGARDHAAACAAIRASSIFGARIDLRESGSRRLLSRPWPRSKRRVGAGR